jgi:DNA-3-methyladenine glycosylase
MPRLGLEFFRRDDVIKVSRQLLGKSLMTKLPGAPVTGGVIVETEAYSGPEDKASHAFDNRRTKRTEVMFSVGGVAYVYLCYGIHSLFNVVTGSEGIPHAVLIRAIQPTHGTQQILERAGRAKIEKAVAAGPGRLTRALGIDTGHTGEDLTGDTIWIEDDCECLGDKDIASGPRIGVDYAGGYAKKPWRFWIKNNEWVSST